MSLVSIFGEKLLYYKEMWLHILSMTAVCYIVYKTFAKDAQIDQMTTKNNVYGIFFNYYSCL